MINQNNVKHTIPRGIKNIESYNNLKSFLNTGDYKYIRTPIKAEEKVGRNDPCPCGSGKKYKRCCGV
jgi:preprotein translocase subunit SecA